MVCSLVPGSDLAGQAIDDLTLLGGEVLLDELDVGGVLVVDLAGLDVLELRVVVPLLRDLKTTGEKNTLDLKVGLVAEHANLTEGDLSAALESLHETLDQVLELVSNSSLSTELLVVDEPEGEACAVNLCHHAVVTLTLLVGDVDEEGLEVEEIEGGRGQGIKWVDFLLGLVLLGLGSSGSSLLGLLLRLEDGLERLLGHLDLAEDGDELGDGGNTRKPGASLGGGLGESLVEDELEGHREGGTEHNIGNGGGGASEPVASEGLVDSAEGLLEGLDTVVELGLGDLSSAEDGVDGGEGSLLDTAGEPVHPGVDLGALDGVGAEEGGVAGGKELGDSVGFLKVALGGLEDGELVGGVERLVVLRCACLIGVNDELGHLAVHLADDEAHVDEDVSGVLGVDFLNKQVKQVRPMSFAQGRLCPKRACFVHLPFD